MPVSSLISSWPQSTVVTRHLYLSLSLPSAFDHGRQNHFTVWAREDGSPYSPPDRETTSSQEPIARGRFPHRNSRPILHGAVCAARSPHTRARGGTRRVACFLIFCERGMGHDSNLACARSVSGNVKGGAVRPPVNQVIVVVPVPQPIGLILANWLIIEFFRGTSV